MKHLLIFGFGFTAQAVAARLPANEWRISATSRSTDKAAAITAQGHQGYVFAGGELTGELRRALASASHVLMSVPPHDNGDPVLAACSNELSESSHLDWLGYLSTIGVYGDHGGVWIDENTPANPQSDRSKRRLESELAWSRISETTGRRLHVFRLAGIYGPGRSAIDRVLSGRARCIIKPGQVFNRIHVADAAAAIAASLSSDARHRMFNLADDLPAAPEEVLDYAARCLDAPAPPRVNFAEAELSDMARSFYAENKRVRNNRIKDDLGLRLRYPTYREGLRSIADNAS